MQGNVLLAVLTLAVAALLLVPAIVGEHKERNGKRGRAAAGRGHRTGSHAGRPERAVRRPQQLHRNRTRPGSELGGFSRR